MRRKIIPITSASREAGQRLGLPRSCAPGSDETVSSVRRARRSRRRPLVVTGLGTLMVIAGIVDSLALVALTGAILTLLGACRLLSLSPVFRLSLRKAGSSPEAPGFHEGPAEDDISAEYNRSIVTRG